jgi:ribosomal protein L11 methyltransferase
LPLVARIHGAALDADAASWLVDQGASELAAEDVDLLGLFDQPLQLALHQEYWPAGRTLVAAELLDWGGVWRPLAVGVEVAGIRIRQQAGGEADDLNLVVGDVFGSAHHPTTAMCLEWVAFGPADAPLLDVGTGTGVLALLALRLGATRARGTDLDPAARECAAQNAAANGLADRFEVQSGLGDASWPRIVANLSSGTVVELAYDLAARLASGGSLAVSGFSVEIAPEVERALLRAGLRRVGGDDRLGWVRLDFAAPW